MLIVAAVTSLYPIAIDFSFNALNEKNVNHLMIIPLGIIILTLIKGVSYFYQTVVVGKISNSIIKAIQLKMYDKIVNFDVLLINQFKQGSLQSRFINDLNILREAITRVLNNLYKRFLYSAWVVSKYALSRLVAYTMCNSYISFMYKTYYFYR